MTSTLLRVFLACLAVSGLPTVRMGTMCQAATVPGAIHQGVQMLSPGAQQQLVRTGQEEGNDQQVWEQELAGLKERILSHVANDLEAAWRVREAPTSQQDPSTGLSLQKRMFVPLSGLPGEAPTIKRKIRYHQCYFNPISCFKRK